jgi:hypothetical protein
VRAGQSPKTEGCSVRLPVLLRSGQSQGGHSVAGPGPVRSAALGQRARPTHEFAMRARKALPLSDGGPCSTRVRAKAACAPHWPPPFSKKVVLRPKLGTPARVATPANPPVCHSRRPACLGRPRSPRSARWACSWAPRAASSSTAAACRPALRRLSPVAHSPSSGTCSAAYPARGLAR